MTVKEFEKKYGVPYTIVRNASFSIRRDAGRVAMHLDYDEDVLADAVRRHIRKQFEYHREQAERYREMFRKVKESGQDGPVTVWPDGTVTTGPVTDLPDAGGETGE